MATPILVPPGKSYERECGQGTPLVKTGQEIPEGAKAHAYVVSVEANKITVGALKAGTLDLGSLCSNDSDSTWIQIEAPDAKEQKIAAPLGLIPQPYPTWLWWALGLIVVLILLIVLGVKKFLNYRKGKFKRPKFKAPPKSSFEQMQDLVTRIQREKWVESPDPAASSRAYAETLKILRACLEDSLGFRMPGATSQEFLNEFKAQALARKAQLKFLDQNYLLQVESMFMQANQAVYAGEIPELPARVAYLRKISELTNIAKPKIETMTGAKKPEVKK